MNGQLSRTVRFAITGAIGILALASVAGAGLIDSAPIARATSVARARAVLRTATGQEVGIARFTQRESKVVVDADIEGLPAEFHGFHVHSIGVCTAPSFTSAGPHFHVDDQKHSNHSGDLPSLLVMEDGTAQARVTTDRFRVADLLAGAGTALIVHAGRDNFANIPTRYAPGGPDATTLATGDSGARIACGVIQGVTSGDDNAQE